MAHPAPRDDTRALHRVPDGGDDGDLVIAHCGYARLDIVHARLIERTGYFKLFRDGERNTGRLFTIPEGGVIYDQACAV
ncbi:hypothetical protein JCM25156A_07500 [Komagataeibacter kakiaceti JCM 25156]